MASNPGLALLTHVQQPSTKGQYTKHLLLQTFMFPVTGSLVQHGSSRKCYKLPLHFCIVSEYRSHQKQIQELYWDIPELASFSRSLQLHGNATVKIHWDLGITGEHCLPTQISPLLGKCGSKNAKVILYFQMKKQTEHAQQNVFKLPKFPPLIGIQGN